MVYSVEEMRQRASEARREAKALQQKLQTLTDADERKQLARQINDLFNEAKKLMDEVKAQRGWEASVERELNSLGVND